MPSQFPCGPDVKILEPLGVKEKRRSVPEK
jgi:hypothetical protein